MFFLIRHGERGDQGSLEEQNKIEIAGDVHLTEIGHKQALQTGEEVAKVLSQLKEDNAVDQDAELCFVSSTLYRCLQNTRMLIQGTGAQLKNNTLYVETGIEEHFSDECAGIDENWRQNSVRFYNREKYPTFAEEVLSKYPHQHNSLFDYQKYPNLTAEYGETITQGAERFQSVINNVGELYRKEEYNPRKTIFVLCSHGLSMEVIYGHIHKDKEHVQPDFCSLNLFEVKKECEEDEHFQVDPKMKNVVAYQM